MADSVVEMSELKSVVAAAIVLYNPTDDVFNNIISWHKQVAFTYVIDNSESNNDNFLNRLLTLDAIHYQSLNGNKGVAAALNTAAILALKNGYQLLLTMDQDTLLPENSVSRLIEQFTLSSSVKPGIVAPLHTGDLSDNTRTQKVLFKMTSGSMMSLAAYSAVGPFLDELFIDHVDHEYGLRLNAGGYTVLQLNDLNIAHRPGNLVVISFLGVRKTFSSHSAERVYYAIRNGLLVANLYSQRFPSFRQFVKRLIAKEILKIFFESEKLKRIKLVIQAFRDYRNKRFGRLV